MAARFLKCVTAYGPLVYRDITWLLSVLWRITVGFGMFLTKQNGAIKTSWLDSGRGKRWILFPFIWFKLAPLGKQQTEKRPSGHQGRGLKQ